MQHLPPPETLPAGVDPPRPISVTFIPASVFDNPALLQVNPEYLAWLLSATRPKTIAGLSELQSSANINWVAIDVSHARADLEVIGLVKKKIFDQRRGRRNRFQPE